MNLAALPDPVATARGSDTARRKRLGWRKLVFRKPGQQQIYGLVRL